MKLTTWRFPEEHGPAFTFASLPWSKTGSFLSGTGDGGTTRTEHADEDVEIYPFNVPLREPFHIALGNDLRRGKNNSGAVENREGVMGWGNPCPYVPVTSENAATDLAIGKDLATFVRGRDPFTLGAIMAEMMDLVRHNASMKRRWRWQVSGISAASSRCSRWYNCSEAIATLRKPNITIGMGTPARDGEQGDQTRRGRFLRR